MPTSYGVIYIHFEATEAVPLWEQLHLIILTTTAALTHTQNKSLCLHTSHNVTYIPESCSVVQNRGRAYTRNLFESLLNFVNIAESMEQSHLSYVVVLCQFSSWLSGWAAA